MTYLVYSIIGFSSLLIGFFSWKLREKYPLAGKMALLIVPVFGLFFVFGSLVFVFHPIRRMFPYHVQFWTIVSLPHIVFYSIYFISGVIFVEWLQTKREFYLAINIVMLIGITVAFFVNFMVDNKNLDSKSPVAGSQLQSSGYSCTAACIVNLCIDFKIPVSEREVADDIQLIGTGASIAQVGYMLEKLGFNFQETNKTSIEDLKPPAILSVSFRGEPNTHVVYVKGKKGSLFLIVDPAQGVADYRDIEWIKENWKGIGMHNISR